jgi:hypothetical protein
LEIANLLIDNGAGINEVDKDEWTPLYSASSEGHLEIVKLLIDKGADINASANNKMKPIKVASLNMHSEVVKFLIENGSDINQDDMNCIKHIDDKMLIYAALKRSWTPKIHKQFPIVTRKSISTVFKLKLKGCQISRLPIELLLLLCSFIANRDIIIP